MTLIRRQRLPGKAVMKIMRNFICSAKTKI